MDHTFQLQPVKLDRKLDSDACSVLVNEALAAIFVRLDPLHDKNAGRWVLEVGFGPCETKVYEIHRSLEAAQAWVAGRYTAAATPPAGAA